MGKEDLHFRKRTPAQGLDPHGVRRGIGLRRDLYEGQHWVGIAIDSKGRTGDLWLHDSKMGSERQSTAQCINVERGPESGLSS